MRLAIQFVAISVCTLWAAQARADRPDCREALTELGVPHRSAKRRGIRDGVVLPAQLLGVDVVRFDRKPIVVDCSLAYSLARSTRFFRDHGIHKIVVSSAYSRRKIRGTRRWSSHSFGLAVDVHEFYAGALGKIRIAKDYEQGLGDVVDCVGRPLTSAGRVLRTLSCQLARSGFYRIVLDPDYDAHHYNHFHIEALPWANRPKESTRLRLRDGSRGRP